MQLFSEDYLMHYGIKGMKWKKHKKEFKTPDEYLDEAYDKLGNYTKADGMTKERLKLHRDRVAGRVSSNGDMRQRQYNIAATYRAKKAESLANERRNADLKKARKKAYKKNQRRTLTQQRRAKVKNTLNQIKKKVFVDTSGKQKVGNLYVSHETHLGR